jgi:hypothetical protein
MENTQLKKNGGPEWFEGMKNSLDFIRKKEDEGLLKPMLFSDLVKLHCPEIL